MMLQRTKKSAIYRRLLLLYIRHSKFGHQDLTYRQGFLEPKGT